MADEPLFTREEVEALVHVFRSHDQSKNPRWVCAPAASISNVFRYYTTWWQMHEAALHRKRTMVDRIMTTPEWHENLLREITKEAMDVDESS